MERGFLKLWRRTIESPVFSDPNLWHMASWCLLRAGHKKRAFRFQAGNQYVVVPLESGQFATGRNSGADELGIKPSTFYKRLKRLSQEPYSFITVTTHSSTLCTVVTICNWQHYQSSTIEEEQPKVTSGEQAGNKRVASGEQAGNTNKNVENVENVENGKKEGASKTRPALHDEAVEGAIIPEHLNTGAFIRAWDDYCEFRKENKKYMTARVVKAAISKLSKLTEKGAIDSLETSVAGGYQGLFTEKYEALPLAPELKDYSL